MASVKYFYFPGIMDGVKIRARITDDNFIYVIDLIMAVTGENLWTFNLNSVHEVRSSFFQ